MLVFPIKSQSNIEMRLLFVDTCFNSILFTESVLKVLPNSNDSASHNWWSPWWSATRSSLLRLCWNSALHSVFSGFIHRYHFMNVYVVPLDDPGLISLSLVLQGENIERSEEDSRADVESSWGELTGWPALLPRRASMSSMSGWSLLKHKCESLTL